MSRYVHTYEDEKGKTWEVAYGYDPPLQEYFLQAFDPGSLGDDENYEAPDRCDENGCLFSISSHTTMRCHPNFPRKYDWSNGEILEQMEKWGVPKAHRDQVALDLPF